MLISEWMPKNITICGLNYSVEVNKTTHQIGSYGKFDYAALEITIASDMPPQTQMSTLIHEIIEAVNFSLSLNLDEATIVRLEAGLASPIYQLCANAVEVNIP